MCSEDRDDSPFKYLNTGFCAKPAGSSHHHARPITHIAMMANAKVFDSTRLH
jgi:transketolase C-terminal domain/subunit